MALAVGLVAAWVAPAEGAPARRIGRLELDVLGVAATLDPLNPVVPRNVASGVRVEVRAGGVLLSAGDVARYLGGPSFRVEAVLSGPGLPVALDLPLPDAPALDPLLLALPPLPRGGDYTLSNIRLTGGASSLDTTPSTITVQVIDQLLVTSVTTRALTLDEIKAKGIVLDRDDYLGFEFTMGLALESQPVNLKFPVVFDRNGVALPLPLEPPLDPLRGGVSLPGTLVPLLLEQEVALPGGGVKRVPVVSQGGEPVRIPSVMLIPGNIGYLKQFFSAMLYVANGAPGGSGLSIREVTGKIKLPLGDDHQPGTSDDPLTIAETVAGHVDTLPIRGVGPDGEPGTNDDQGTLGPGEQGQAEFLLRGEREGFHRIAFDIDATLDGLATGPVVVKGHASGGVLVRNPYFDVTFTVPSVVRADEPFKLYATVRNVGQGPANDVKVTLTGALANLHLAQGAAGTQTIDTIVAGDARMVEFDLVPEVTGQVVASYLRFNGDAASGTLRFTLGVGERGVALSPDTLVLPAAVDALPQDVVRAAMRVLGQAWSIAGAVPGTLPPGVARINKSVVVKKALALAEAGLRVTLGQAVDDALRDVLLDFHGGEPFDTAFDQLLRQTQAGRALDLVLGAHLGGVVGSNVVGYEAQVSEVVGSGPDALVFAVESPSGAPSDVQVVDGLGRRTFGRRLVGTLGADVPGVVLVPLGAAQSAPILGFVARPTASPYVFELSGSGSDFDVSLTLPEGDGGLRRAVVSAIEGAAGARTRVTADLSRPDVVVVEEDLDADGVYESRREEPTSTLHVSGPELVSATVIGPETVDGAAPFGFNLALLFDRVVDDVSSSQTEHYEIPDNRVRSARRQLSGRLVFANLELPEGPYVATSVRASQIQDRRGHEGPSREVELASRLEDPGAIVSGRIFNADGSTPNGAVASYAAPADWTECEQLPTGFAAMPLNAGGFYEFRYVHQDHCGRPFAIVTRDPVSGARREVTGYVRAPGEHIVLDIALLGRGSVEGHVRKWNGTPAVGAAVVALSQTDPQSGGRAQSDANGYYRIDDISVGPITVKAVLGTGLGMGAGRIDRAGTTATVDLTLDGDTVNVSGTVYRVVEGVDRPAPAVLVLYKVDNTAVGAVVSDANGRFVFSGMPVGSFMIDARLSTGESGFVTGVASAGQTIPDLVLRLHAPNTQEYGSIEGTVVLPDGVSHAGGGVFVALGGASAGTLTREDGTYTLPRVPVRPNQYQTVTAVTRDGQRRGSNRFILSTPGEVVPGVDITLSGTGTARFVIKDASGQPINGLSVGAVYGQCSEPCGCRFAVTGHTGNDGEVTFDNVPVGGISAHARVTLNGVTDAVEGALQIRFDGDQQTAVVQFGGTGRVSGLVTDDQRRGLHGAQVELVSNVFVYDAVTFTCGLRPRKSHVVRTAPGPSPAIGSFAFDKVLVGPVRLSAHHEFFPRAVGAQGTLTRAGEERHFELALVNTFAGLVSGTVYLPDGVSAAGPGVEVKFDGPLPNVVVETDAQSRYELDGILPAGAYTVTVSDPVTGGVTQERVYLRAGEDFPRDFRLRGRGTVRVRVVDGADQPVQQAWVKLRESGYPNGEQERALSAGEDGWVEFARVLEGDFAVTAVDTAARAGRVTGHVSAPGDVVELTLRLTTTGSVAGVFRMPPPSSAPIPFGTVKLIAGGRVIGQASTAGSGDAVGSFRFDYVPAGPVRLEALDPLTGRSGVAFGAIEGEGDLLSLDVVAQGLGRVHGTVWSNAAAMPLARVELVSGGYRTTVLADGNGVYDVRGVPEGRVVVTASVQGTSNFLAGTASGELVGDASDLPLEVHLRGSGSVSGQVVPALAGAAAPASVVSATVGGFGGATLTTPTQPGGAFSFPMVPAGAAQLLADVSGSVDFGKATADVPAGGNAVVEIHLTGVGTIVGQALKPDGMVLGSWRVRVENGHGQRFWLDLPTSGASAGQFTLRDVLAGEFDVALEATLVGGARLYGSGSGTLAPGGEAALTVTLQPSGTISGRVLRPVAAGLQGAYGAELTLSGPNGSIRTQADGNGAFTLRGVPVAATAYTLKASDPVGGGRAVVPGIALNTANQTLVLPDVVLDNVAPTVEFVEPQDGSSRAGLKGTLTLVLDDVGSGIDSTSLQVIYPNGATQGAGEFSFAGGQASAVLRDPSLVVGENRLTAVVRDAAGHETRRTITWQVTGATLRGRVTYFGGSAAAAGVSVKVGTHPAVVTDAAGEFVRTGLREGNFTVVATAGNGVSVTLPSVHVEDGQQVTAPDLVFPEFAQIVGYVHHPGGAAAGGVQVSIPGKAPVTSRAGDGYFDLGFVAAGTYTVTAQAANGDMGRTSANVTAGSGPLELTLNGVGSVTVLVRTASQGAVSSATVTLTSASPFGGSYAANNVGPAGVTFPHVLVGPLTARATDNATQLQGVETGYVSDGGSATLTVTLEAGARIAGQVTPHAGGAGVNGVLVRITSGPRGGSTTSSGNGEFAFENLPLGTYALRGESPDGDRGETSVVLSTAGATGDGSMQLTGLGELAVSVQDASGAAVPNAGVRVRSTHWGTWWDAATGASGEPAQFPRVLAGAVSITADAEGLSGQLTAQVNPGPGNTAVVTLQAAGTIQGMVYAPGTTTGVDGVTLRLDGLRTVVSHDGGLYELTAVPLGSHSLRAELGGRVRGHVAGLSLATHNQVVTHDFTLSGVATVSGTILAPGGTTPAGGARVDLVSLAPWPLGGTFTTTSDTVSGAYSFADVPVGAYGITAERVAQGQRVDATGVVEAHAQAVTHNLTLLASVVSLPLSLADGNAFPWTLMAPGGMRNAVLFSDDGPALSLVRDGQAAPFVGAGTYQANAGSEENKREIVVEQTGLAGLRVTRKVFVPSDGYFVRWLEILENTTSESVSVDVVVTTPLRAGVAAFATSSSQGGPVQSSDRWVAVDDGDTRDVYETAYPAGAFPPLVFVGAGADAAQAPVAELGASGLTWRWTGVEVPPGARRVFMHLLSPQTDQARALATAQRLMALPPEVLVGLSLDEAAQVRNFAVPADLSSALPALPANDGGVDLRALSGDAVTGVPGLYGHLRSASAHYGRRIDLGPTAADGRVTLAARLDPTYGVKLVPREGFTVAFSTDVFGTQTATASGTVPAVGAAAADVVFNGTGAIEGLVKRTDGSTVAGSNVALTQGASVVERRNLGDDGRFLYAVVPPGTYTLSAAHPLGGVSVSQTVEVSSGQKLTQDLVFPALGSVQVTVRTAAPAHQAAGSWLKLQAPGGFVRNGGTSASLGGSFVFSDVPPGTYDVVATDPRTSAIVTQPVSVVAGALTPALVTLPPTAPLHVRARVEGRDLGAAAVYWRSNTRPSEIYAGLTSSSLSSLGVLNISAVAGEQVHVRVVHPLSAHAQGEADVAVTSEGTPVSVTIDVPGVGAVTGLTRTRDDVVAGGVSVSALHPAHTTLLASAVSDSTGAFTLVNLPVGVVRLRTRVTDTYAGGLTYAKGELRAELSSDGATLTRNALVPRGRLAHVGQREPWEFTATAGAAVDVLLLGAAHGGVPALADPALDVYGPDGALVASNDDISASDPNARVGFTATSSGRYTVVVRAPASATGAYRLLSGRDDETHVYRAYTGGAVSGVVTRAPSGQPLAGWSIRLVRAGIVVAGSVTDAEGGYELPLFTAGTYAVEVLDAAGVVVARAADLVAASAETRLTRELTLPARELVTVRARRGPAPVSGVEVTIASDHPAAVPEDATRQVTTDAAGDATAVVPVGTVTATAFDVVSQTTVSTPGALVEGTPLSVTLAFPEAVSSIHGVVSTSADPTLVLPGAQVELRLVGAPTAWSSTTGDAAGEYRFDGVPSGTYTLTASFATGFATPSESRQVVASGGNVVADVQLPVWVVVGTVTEADASPVVGATVRACGWVSGSYTCAQRSSAAGGDFMILGLPEWPAGGTFNVIAIAADGSGASASVSRVHAAVPTRYTATLTLPDTDARLRVRVFDSTGQERVPQALVRLVDSGGRAERTAVADIQGEVLFRRVSTYYDWHAYAEASDGLPGVSPTVSVVAGTNPDLDVRLMEHATLSVTLDDGAGQLLERQVSVTAPDVRTWFEWPLLRRWTRSLTTSSAGAVSLRVPGGAYRVVFEGDDDGSGDLIGQAGDEGHAVPGATPLVTLTRGTHTLDTQPLGGPAASYCLHQPPVPPVGEGLTGVAEGPAPDAGALNASVECDPSLSPVLWTFASDSIRAEGYPAVVKPELAGRGYASFLVKGAQVEVRRLQWVAPAGAFERTLTVLHNTGTEGIEVTLDVVLDASVEVVTTSSGDWQVSAADRYVVVRSSSDVQRDGAVVWGDVAAASLDSSAPTALGVIQLAPGETKSFLTFTAWRLTGPCCSELLILGLANSLADLSHPEALTGLTQDERDTIANFAPPAAPTGVTGTVFVSAEPGAAVVPGADVGVLRFDAQMQTDVLVARGVSGADGVFTLIGVPPGEVTLAARDPQTGRANLDSAPVTAGALTPRDVALATSGSVRVYDAVWGGMSQGQPVVVSAEGYGSIGSFTLLLDAQGQALFTGVPAGNVTVSWDYGNQSTTVTVSEGEELSVPIEIPPATVAAPLDLSDADGPEGLVGLSADERAAVVDFDVPKSLRTPTRSPGSARGVGSRARPARPYPARVQ